MNLTLAFAFACHFESFYGLADTVRKLMHGQTLIHSCGDLMIPKRQKLLMKVLRRLQRLLRMPSTLSETPSLFCLCLAQIIQAAAAAGNQHKILSISLLQLLLFFLWLILQSAQFGCAFVSTHFMCQPNRLRLRLLPDNQNTNWQVAPPLAVAGYHSFAHSN